jgi:glycosyl transferase, family 25
MSCLVQVINLAKATDRLHQFDEQARRAGFSYDRFQAIDGSEPGVQEITRGTRLSVGINALRSNEIAIGLSHRACWRRFLESDFETTVIFEDDVVLAPGFESVFQKGWLPKDADIIKLETFQSQSTKVLARVDGRIGGRSVHRLRADHVGCAAYLVTRKGAEHLLSLVREISAPIDIILFCVELPIFHRCKIYQMVPAPCTQGMFVNPAADWTKSSIQVPVDKTVSGQPVSQAESDAVVGTWPVWFRRKRRSFSRSHNRIKAVLGGRFIRGIVPFA